QDGRVDIQTKNTGYGGNGNRNAGRQNRNQAFNAGNGNDDNNQIVQRVPRTESTSGKENVQEQMLLAMKDEAGSNLNNEENDFMLDTSYGEETMEELTAAVMLMARIQPADGNPEIVPSYDAKAVSETTNKVYDLFLKAELGYKNPEHLKKAIATQLKMYDDEKLHSVHLKIDSPYSEETLEDAEESRLKMRNKMVQISYGK
ncbi:hypothetical protein Tco_0576189, partial [Tanacetum coccineum]